MKPETIQTIYDRVHERTPKRYQWHLEKAGPERVAQMTLDEANIQDCGDGEYCFEISGHKDHGPVLIYLKEFEL